MLHHNQEGQVRPEHLPQLYELIDRHVADMVMDARAAGWTTADAIAAINAVIRKRWMPADPIDEVEAKPNAFVSDGNEG